jgi:hypothetical protein
MPESAECGAPPTLEEEPAALAGRMSRQLMNKRFILIIAAIFVFAGGSFARAETVAADAAPDYVMMGEAGAAKVIRNEAPADQLKVPLDDSPSGGGVFTFCAKPPAGSPMVLTNAQWLSMISANEYAHLAYFAPQLSGLGFGRPGDELWAVCGADLARVHTFEADHAAELDRAKTAGANALVSYMKGKSLSENFGVCAREFLETKYTGLGEDRQPALPTESFKDYLLRTNDDSSWMQFYTGRPYTFMEKVLGKGSTQVVMARHSRLPVVIISFRGTQNGFELSSLSDFFTNLILTRSDTAKLGFSPGWGTIHTGFLNGMRSLDDMEGGESLLMTKLKELTGDDPDVGIWLTGHSLGGALATIMAARILDEADHGVKYNLKGLYTYGSPRVGNAEFAAKFNELAAARGVQVVRFRKGDDVVTGIPGLFMGYRHVGRLAFLADDKLDLDLPNEPGYGSRSIEDHNINGYYTRIGRQRPLRADLDLCESIP